MKPTDTAILWVTSFSALLLFIAIMLAGCGTVRVTAEREGRCSIRATAPFRVVCHSDGREVLDWSGPMALTVEESGGVTP